jgi:hypothetical protein
MLYKTFIFSLAFFSTLALLLHATDSVTLAACSMAAEASPSAMKKEVKVILSVP